MKNIRKLTILHSNDLHGDFLAENVDANLVGGVSRLSGYLSKVRYEEDNVLYCIAGDMFRGSVIDSEFKGLSTIEIMNMLSPDVVTIGNHETDYGVAHLLFIEKMAKFPIINANLHITTNGARLFQPYKVIEIDGMKILFIGILTEDVISQTKNDGLIGSFVSIEDAAKEVGRICNAYNAIDIDLTVLLTHIGYQEDKILAKHLEREWGVDIIIGGHSHTLLKEAEKVNDILIVQAGTGTDQIGRFDIDIDVDNNCVDSYKWETIPINPQTCPEDEEIEKILNNYKNQTDAKYQRVVTRLCTQLTHPDRQQETEIGNLYADAFRDSLGVDISFVGSGSIRTEKIGPIVLLQDLMENYPYDGVAYMIKVNGKDLKEGVKHICRDEVWTGVHSEYYQLSSGLEIVYSKSKHDFLKFDFNGAPIEDEHLYKISLSQFHLVNMKANFGWDIDEICKNGNPKILSTSEKDVLEEYLSNHQLLYREVEGRLTVVD